MLTGILIFIGGTIFGSILGFGTAALMVMAGQWDDREQRAGRG